MTPRASIEFLALAALWGASFLFIRIAAPSFGPLPLMMLRCGIGALTLLPMLWWFGKPADLRANALHIAVVGVLNSAVPFVLLAFAALVLSAGITSVLNSLAPLWGALIAFAWLGDRLTRLQLLGLALGVGGVTVLALAGGTGTGEAPPSGGALAWAFAAGLAATAFYGLGANYARRHLQGVNPLAIATGSQVSAALVLLIPGLSLWPVDAAPGAGDWGAVLVLGTLCTGFAYILFFDLIAMVGATRTIAVTFVIPVFGILWGLWILDEHVGPWTLAGAAVIVTGTALSTGVLRPRRSGR